MPPGNSMEKERGVGHSPDGPRVGTGGTPSLHDSVFLQSANCARVL